MPIPRNPHPDPMALPPLLRAGFRPFFLGGALWALVVAGLWVAAMAGAITLPSAFDPLAWHRHEMLFGYIGAVIAGFLMTAIPNWTGRLPLAGAPLAALAGLWLAARLAVLFSSIIGAEIAFALDSGFLLVLVAACAREVLVAKNRNLPIVIVVALFALANIADHAEAFGLAVPAGLGWRSGFALVLLLLTLIGGRIVPSFTRNWLARSGVTDRLPSQPSRFDKAVIVLLALALLGWVILPNSLVTGALLVAAGLFQALRLGRWSGLRAAGDPLVFILHLSYAWLPAGLLLLGSAAFLASIPASAGLHALGAGAMASMTLAVMTRATLGHTGRELSADRLTLAIYVLVTAGATTRVAAPFVSIDYLRLIEVAGLLWAGAFLLFLIGYGPKLLGPRPDGRA